jgi:hypothetical protein
MSLDTEPEAIRPKKPSRKGCDCSGPRELSRMVLDVLREATEPVTHHDVARVVMERKEAPAGDQGRRLRSGGSISAG